MNRTAYTRPQTGHRQEVFALYSRWTSRRAIWWNDSSSSTSQVSRELEEAGAGQRIVLVHNDRGEQYASLMVRYAGDVAKHFGERRPVRGVLDRADSTGELRVGSRGASSCDLLQ